MDPTLEPSTENNSEARGINHKVSKFKLYASQFYATFATNLIKLTSGSLGGFTAILIAEFLKDDAEIYMSADDVSWFSSRYFTVPLGALLCGVVAHNIGNRLTMIIAAFLYVALCLAFYFATNATTLLSVQAILGLIIPSSTLAGNSYVIEIAQPHLRSSLTASYSLSVIISGFFVVLLSNFLHWRIIALVMLIFPTIGFLAMCTVPESPYWLANRGQFDKAKAALSWVRGWTTIDKVESEFSKIKETCEKISFESNHVSTRDCSSNFQNMSQLKNCLQPYLHRAFYVPLATMCCLFILLDISGYHVLNTFFIVIFRKMDSPIDPHVAGSLFDGARVLGALVFISSVHYTGKKKLAYISLTVATISYFTISIVLFLKSYHIFSDVCSWIAVITMILSTFSTSAGIDKLAWILNVEIFPTRFRNIGSAICLFVSNVMAALCNKLFLYLLDILTLPGMFVLFGMGCILNSLLLYIILPETEGKSLKEIEEHYYGVKKIKN